MGDLLFEESPVSKLIWEYFSKRIGQIMGPIGVAKSCAVLSSQLPPPRLGLFVVAPTRQFKSFSSVLVKDYMPRKFYVDLGSDFTVHGLKYQYGDKLDKKCLMINDATLLFRTKSKRGKDRLINALAELKSDGFYRYAERTGHFEMNAEISIIMNMTSEAYMQDKDALLGSTFLERFLTLFYSMPMVEQREYLSEEKQKKMVKKLRKIRGFFTKKPKKNGFFLENFGKFHQILIEIAKDFSALSLKSFIGTYDQLVALVHAHASLNRRDYMCQDDIDFVKSLESYVNDFTAPNQGKIVQLSQNGHSQRDICLILGMNPERYKPYVSRVLKKAKLRGLTN